MNDNIKFTNKNGSLTRYSFACGYIERVAWDEDGNCIDIGDVPYTDNYSQLSLANGEISLWDIKASVGNCRTTWLQRTGLTNARKCFAKCKAIVKKVAKGKLTVDEGKHQLELLGFED